jgi:hypothetical protein
MEKSFPSPGGNLDRRNRLPAGHIALDLPDLPPPTMNAEGGSGSFYNINRKTGNRPMENGLRNMGIAKNRAELVQVVKRDMLYFLEAPPAAEMGGYCEMISGRFQALAICHFIENLDLAEFGINLRRSACARRFFLERSDEDGNTRDRFLALSRTEAFFDALVGGSRPLAMDIAAASGSEWNPDWESEADFHYFRFLHLLLLDPRGEDADQIEALLRISRACTGKRSPRLSAGWALMDGDAKAFRNSLEAMLETKRDADRARMRDVAPGDFLLGPRSLLSLEGLALMRLAQLRGLGDAALPRNPLCPRLALLPWTDTSSEDIFRKMRIEVERQAAVP